MNEFLMFLMDNYIWILVVIVLIIITIIGFLADKNKTKEKKEIKESTPVSQVDMPTFIHDGNVSTQKDLLQQESSAGNEEPKVVENNPQNNILNNTMPEQNKVENNLPQPMMTNNNQGLNSQPIQNTIHGPMSTPMGVNTTIPQPMNVPPMQPQQPVIPQPVNTAPVHEPIKVSPIPGMTGSAVSFVNGPTNNNPNQQ